MLGETLDFFVEGINHHLFLFAFLDLMRKTLFHLAYFLRLLYQLLRQLFVLLDLLCERDLNAPLALFELFDFCQGSAERNQALLFERHANWRHHAISTKENTDQPIE